MNRANYRVIIDRPNCLVLEDLGPWTKHPTITNDADRVVADLLPRLDGRHLFYFDSESEFSELAHDGKRFVGFRAVAFRFDRDRADVFCPVCTYRARAIGNLGLYACEAETCIVVLFKGGAS